MASVYGVPSHRVQHPFCNTHASHRRREISVSHSDPSFTSFHSTIYLFHPYYVCMHFVRTFFHPSEWSVGQSLLWSSWNCHCNTMHAFYIPRNEYIYTSMSWWCARMDRPQHAGIDREIGLWAAASASVYVQSTAATIFLQILTFYLHDFVQYACDRWTRNRILGLCTGPKYEIWPAFSSLSCALCDSNFSAKRETEVRGWTLNRLWPLHNSHICPAIHFSRCKINFQRLFSLLRPGPQVMNFSSLSSDRDKDFKLQQKNAPYSSLAFRPSHNIRNKRIF